MRTLRPLTILALLTLISTLSITATMAQTAPVNDGVHSNIAFGVRSGYTAWDGLNQIHLGAHLKLGEILPNVQLTPNLEAGFGDGASLIAINGDLAYSFTEFVAHPWNLYGGGSLSIFYLNPDNHGSTTDLGLSGLIGLERTLANEHQAMVEIRFGLIDSPDFKLTFGYNFF